jgi:hypothetical protein
VTRSTQQIASSPQIYRDALLALWADIVRFVGVVTQRPDAKALAYLVVGIVAGWLASWMFPIAIW